MKKDKITIAAIGTILETAGWKRYNWRRRSLYLNTGYNIPSNQKGQSWKVEIKFPRKDQEAKANEAASILQSAGVFADVEVDTVGRACLLILKSQSVKVVSTTTRPQAATPEEDTKQ